MAYENVQKLFYPIRIIKLINPSTKSSADNIEIRIIEFLFVRKDRFFRLILLVEG